MMTQMAGGLAFDFMQDTERNYRVQHSSSALKEMVEFRKRRIPNTRRLDRHGFYLRKSPV
jgi:hypothetical protein